MRGATTSEIADVEAWLGARLPDRYRDFLLEFGNDHDGPLRGSDCFVSDLRSNNHYLPELLAENDIVGLLPSRYLRFLMHQGYIAAWFDLSTQAEDPECWYYSEGSSPKPQGHFSTFMPKLVKEWVGLRYRARNRIEWVTTPS